MYLCILLSGSLSRFRQIKECNHSKCNSSPYSCQMPVHSWHAHGWFHRPSSYTVTVYSNNSYHQAAIKQRIWSMPPRTARCQPCIEHSNGKQGLMVPDTAQPSHTPSLLQPFKSASVRLCICRRELQPVYPPLPTGPPAYASHTSHTEQDLNGSNLPRNRRTRTKNLMAAIYPKGSPSRAKSAQGVPQQPPFCSRPIPFTRLFECTHNSPEFQSARGGHSRSNSLSRTSAAAHFRQRTGSSILFDLEVRVRAPPGLQTSSDPV